MQEQELYDDQKQAKDAGQIDIQEILPFLHDPHASQGNKIGWVKECRPVALTVRAPDSKSG
jgi:hypothetical protein